MSATQPEFIYVALVLPSLFAVTLIIEGLHKLLRRESGWVSLALGLSFLGMIFGTYFFVLK